ncbi:hypothetical protein IRJ41_017134, partial [Triplophysa rosa]
ENSVKSRKGIRTLTKKNAKVGMETLDETSVSGTTGVFVAPTANLAEKRKSHELEMCKLRVEWQKEKIDELTKERDYLKEQLASGSSQATVLSSDTSSDSSVESSSDTISDSSSSSSDGDRKKRTKRKGKGKKHGKKSKKVEMKTDQRGKNQNIISLSNEKIFAHDCIINNFIGNCLNTYNLFKGLKSR